MIKEIYKKFLESNSISIDTRSIHEGDFFVAIKGDNFDANTFAQSAIKKGAKYVLLDNADFIDKNNNDRYILVKNSLKTLQELANYHRKNLATPILAITGTNGKTTTKELCHAVLSQKLNVFATKGNYNNHIGVPLSLLSINKQHDIAIIEMGANHQGEIKELCTIAEPDFGIITNIGKAHLEGFGDTKTIQKTKKELFDFISSKKGDFFYLKEEIKIDEFACDYFKSHTFSVNNHLKSTQFSTDSTTLFSSIKVNNNLFKSNLFGNYNSNNIAAAYTIAKFFDLNDLDIKKGLENYYPNNNRSQIKDTKTNKLIIDAYNANPTSLTLAINSFLKTINTETKTLILGDMFELGLEANKEHTAIINHLLQNINLFNSVVFIGNNFYENKINKTNFNFYKTRGEFEKQIENSPITNSTILLKGSRSIGLENLIEKL